MTCNCQHCSKTESAMQVEAREDAPALPFQARVQPWMMACFGAEIAGDKLERGDRLLEEVLELLQSGDYPPERVAALTAYVYGRPVGEPSQEVGGVMVTLAAYCLAHGLDMHEAAEVELSRIWTKVETIRAKQAAKPKGSALPVQVAAPAAQQAVDLPSDEEVADAIEFSFSETHEWPDGDAEIVRAYLKYRPASQPMSRARPDLVEVAEAMRKRFVKLPRFSFWLGDPPSVRRVPDRQGNWLEFETVHTLFDPVHVDAALRDAGFPDASGGDQ